MESLSTPPALLQEIAEQCKMHADLTGTTGKARDAACLSFLIGTAWAVSRFPTMFPSKDEYNSFILWVQNVVTKHGYAAVALVARR